MRTLLNLCMIFMATLMLSSCVSKSKFSALENSHRELRAEYQTQKNKISELSEEKAKLSIIRRQLGEDFSNIQSSLASTENELESLKMAIKDYETFNSAKEFEYDKIAEVAPANNIPQKKFVADYYKSPTSINFNSGSAHVTFEDKGYLEQIASQFLANPSIHYIIEGHTDHRPMKKGARIKDNWELSKKRGESVAKVLVEMGVDPSQFTVVAKADTQPLVSGYELGLDELAKNRRVEIVAQVDPGQELFDTYENSSISVSPGLYN